MRGGPSPSSSSEFIEHPLLTHFIATLNDTLDTHLTTLWFNIENFLLKQKNSSASADDLKQVEKCLQKCLSNITPETKERGTAMLPIEIANIPFMINLYSINNEHLINLFLKYLPPPRAEAFKYSRLPLPAFIAKQDKESKNVINKISNHLPMIEKIVISKQRSFRSLKRKKEDLKRILWRYSEEKMTPDEAKQLLADANKPYRPHCDSTLATRIMNASQKVKLFSTIKHLTAPQGLSNIFNDCLYGRRTLLQFYLYFTPAFLHQNDINEGDGNAICLGANNIDPKSKNGTSLEFDAQKISENNSCVFYKQKDLGYCPNKKRQLRIGTLNLFFSHTEYINDAPQGTSSFSII
jgi:hypothetical protein